MIFFGHTVSRAWTGKKSREKCFYVLILDLKLYSVDILIYTTLLFMNTKVEKNPLCIIYVRTRCVQSNLHRKMCTYKIFHVSAAQSTRLILYILHKYYYHGRSHGEGDMGNRSPYGI